MSEAVKHTPAPWEWKDDDKDEFGNYRLSPGILVTALPDGTPWGDDIDKANARLIATAPDLLAAAKAVIAQWETPNWKLTEPTAKFMSDLRDAISKAEPSS